MITGAGPYQPQALQPELPVSPMELFKVLCERDADPRIVSGGFWSGGAEQNAQQLGAVALMPAGLVQIDRYAPVQWERVQARCMAHTLAHSTRIAQHMKDLFHVRHRELVTQHSSGNTYLIHRTALIAGPSAHWDSPATWENLMFFEVMVGTQPVS